MLLAVENRLIQMCDAPSLGNVILKKFCQSLRCRPCRRIPPGAERYKKFPVLIKCHISMHHRAEPDRADACQRCVIFFPDVTDQFPVAVFKPCPYILQRICPEPILQPVLPFVVARRYRIMTLIHKHRLNPRRAKLQPKRRLPALNHPLDLFFVPHAESLLTYGMRHCSKAVHS